MIKRNKGLMFVTTIVILLPAVLGLVMWNQFPEQMPVHWNFSGEPDRYGGRAEGILLVPAILAALHWMMAGILSADPKSECITGKPSSLCLWILPVLSVGISFLTFGAALGYHLNVIRVVTLLLGILLVVFGNYMPKFRPNYTMGIRVPWTLHDPENWRKTHRFGGVTAILAGLILVVSTFIGGIWSSYIAAVILLLVPILYSYLLYRKTKKAE